MKGEAINISPAAYKTLMSSRPALVNLNLSWNGAVKSIGGLPCSAVHWKLFLGMARSKLFHHKFLR